MRRGTWSIRIAIVGVCLGATLYEIPNLRLVRRIRVMAEQDVAALVTEDIAAADPEAAALLRWCLAEPNLDSLAELTMRYPQNEFFLAELAERLIDVNCISRHGALACADRLIALAPENAHYRYLKGWILLKPPGKIGRERDAVDQFNAGHALAQFYLPYDKYADRLDVLLDSMGLPWLARGQVRPGGGAFYTEFSRFVWPPTPFAAATGKPLSGEIFRTAGKTGHRLNNNTSTFGMLEAGVFLVITAERTRLMQSDLSPVEATRLRQRIAQAIALRAILQRWTKDTVRVAVKTTELTMASLLPVALVLLLAIVWLVVVVVTFLRGRAGPVRVGIGGYLLFFFGWLGLWALSLLTDDFLPGLAGVLLIGTAVGLWYLLRLLSRVQPAAQGRFKPNRLWILVICGVPWALGCAGPIGTMIVGGLPTEAVDWLVLIGKALLWTAFWTTAWAVGTYRPHVFRSIPYRRIAHHRVTQLVLFLLLTAGLGSLSTLVSPTVAPWAVILVILWLVIVTIGMALICTHVAPGRVILWDGLRHFMARNGEVVASRAKIVRLLSVALVVGWLAALVMLHVLSGTYRRFDLVMAGPLASHGLLPQATEQTYKRLLTPPDPAHSGSGATGLPDHMSLASPADIAAFIAERQAAGRPLTDDDLLDLGRFGGRDIRTLVLDTLSDPNAPAALEVRAGWGDSAVRPQLAAALEEKIAALSRMAPLPEVQSHVSDFHRSLDSTLKMIATLAPVSTSEETRAYFEALMPALVQYWRDGQAETEAETEATATDALASLLTALSAGETKAASMLYATLRDIPAPVASAVFNRFVEHTDLSDLVDDSGFPATLGQAGTRKLAEQVIGQIAAAAPSREMLDVPVGRVLNVYDGLSSSRRDTTHESLEAAFPYLTTESIPLLLEHLASTNGQLRAFAVWRLTTLGYAWSAEQISALQQDDNWKVRLNILPACTLDGLTAAASDENAVVRASARLLHDAPSVDTSVQDR